jgi:hypothetical protein
MRSTGIKTAITVAFVLITTHIVSAQVDSASIENNRLDSVYIAETEERKGSEKVLHAEPLFIDLIRDLGARKGEREWNVGVGMTDNERYDAYTTLVEYEFAPVNRLGLEFELPFTFYYGGQNGLNRPGSRLNSLKMAGQYTFLVNDKHKTSMALGYIHELVLPEFRNYGNTSWLEAQVFNPFLVMAKRWGQNFHTLNYSGPHTRMEHTGRKVHNQWQVNTSLHYMIDGTRNFIGMEVNKDIEHGKLTATVRPQMRVGLADNLLVGIVTGIPVRKQNERISTFMRLIYEPRHRH